MPNKCTSFFKNNDQLGSGVSLNYRGDSGFGTILGGTLSLIATLFFTMFIGIQLYSWMFQPSYNQSFGVEYLNKREKTVYEIPMTSFLPTVGVARLDENYEPFDFNNRTDWFIEYTLVNYADDSYEKI